jgi:hypothetical protein
MPLYAASGRIFVAGQKASPFDQLSKTNFMPHGSEVRAWGIRSDKTHILPPLIILDAHTCRLFAIGGLRLVFLELCFQLR